MAGVEGAVAHVEVPLRAVLVLPGRGEAPERRRRPRRAPPHPRRRGRGPRRRCCTRCSRCTAGWSLEVAGLALVDARCRSASRRPATRRSTGSCAGDPPGARSSASRAAPRARRSTAVLPRGRRGVLVAVAGVERGGDRVGCHAGTDRPAGAGVIGAAARAGEAGRSPAPSLVADDERRRPDQRASTATSCPPTSTPPATSVRTSSRTTPAAASPA